MKPNIYADSIAIFSGLSPKRLDSIEHHIIWKYYNKSEQILHHKEESSNVYFLGSGKARATIFSMSGREISYEDLSPGAMFGELSAIDGNPRSSNVVAVEKSVIGSMTSADFWQVMRENPSVAEAVMHRLTGMVRFLCNRVYEFGALDVNSRVRAQILRLARENMTGENSAEIKTMPTHMEIANRISTHREAVTRELNELSKAGIIEQQNRVLVVHDMDRLADMIPEDI